MRIRPFYEIPYEEWLFKNHPYVKEDHPEEKVRQWVLRELIDTYHYPREWINEYSFYAGRITIEESVQVGSTQLRADIAIKNEFKMPFIFIETKKFGEDLNAFGGANPQLHSYMAITLSARIGLATNGEDTQCFRKQFDPREELLPHPDLPHYELQVKPTAKPEELQRLSTDKGDFSENNSLEVLLDERLRDDTLQTVPHFDRLLHKCHNILRTEENMHPDEALDEMCKILNTKIYDEMHTRSNSGEEYKFSIWRYGNPEELSSAIRIMYHRAIEEEKQKLKVRGIYDRSRDVFDEPIVSKDSTLSTIVRLLQNYSIVNTSVDTRGQAFENFLGATFRYGLGQYFTPNPVVRLMVGVLDPQPEHLILDPACGSARFLTHCLHYVREQKIKGRYSTAVDNKKIVNFAIYNLHGIEVSRRLVRVAVTDMIMYDDGHTNIRCITGDGALSDFDQFFDLEREHFDCVITNPPYGGDPVKDPSVLGRFTLGRKEDGVGVMKSQEKELLFLDRCFEFLKPGGRLVILLHDGVLANKRTERIRRWYRDKAKLKAVISLPNVTFTPYGAKGIETSVLVLRKWRTDEEIPENYDVFVGHIEDVGYTADGRPCRCAKCVAYRRDLHADKQSADSAKDEVEDYIIEFQRNVNWND